METKELNKNSKVPFQWLSGCRMIWEKYIEEQMQKHFGDKLLFGGMK